MTRSRFLAVAALALVLLAPAFAANITGEWMASFDTQLGVQNYIYDFKVDAGKITGTALATR
jgi:hypothetical protein